MIGSMKSKKNGFFGWIIIILLILGLVGFAFTDVLTGGSSSAVARVGKTEVTLTEYRVAFENRVNAIQRQTGQRIDGATAQAVGIDQQVLGELLRGAALMDEATRVGLDMPDEVVQRALLETPGLSGTDGTFDAASYEFFLSQRGLTTARFEAIVRDAETTGTLGELLAAGAGLPPIAADALLSFLGEERTIEYVSIPAVPVDAELPDTAALAAWLEENAEQFERPEQRVISYARLTPDMLASGMDFEDDVLRAEYERDITAYQSPERRIVDRLAFPDTAAAEAARAAIEAGETTLGDLAEERGLSAGDISLGLVAANAVDRAAREAVFGLEETGLVGPVNTDLGPALFSVNAIVPASEVAFEDAREDLRAGLARLEAEELVIAESFRVEELIAGGASVEEIAEETEYELGTATVENGLTGSVPAEVIAEAFASDIGADRDQIEAGALNFYAVRVDEIIEPQVPPLEEIRAEVAQAWRDAQAQEAARARAEELEAALADGLTLATLAEREDLTLQREEGLTREADAGFLPPQIVAELFEAEPGTTLIVEDAAGALLVSLAEVVPYDLEGEDAATLRSIVLDQTRADVQNDLVGYFANAIADERGITVDQPALDYIVQSLR